MSSFDVRISGEYGLFNVKGQNEAKMDSTFKRSWRIPVSPGILFPILLLELRHEVWAQILFTLVSELLP